MKARELLRWIAVLTFGGFAIYGLVECFPVVADSEGAALMLPVTVCVFFLLVVVPLMMAYFTFRRRYYEVCSVLAMLGAIVVGGILMGLPRRWHWHEFLSGSLMDSSILGLVGLGLSLLFLFGPFFAAAWFYRFCMRLATRYVPPPLRSWPTPTVDEECLPRDNLK